MKSFQKIFYFLTVTIAVAVLISLIYSDTDSNNLPKHEIQSTHRQQYQTPYSNNQHIDHNPNPQLTPTSQVIKKLASQNIPSTEAEDKLKKALKFISKKNRFIASAKPEQKKLQNNNLLNTTPWKLWANTKVINYDSNLTAQQILGRVSNLAIIEDNSNNDALTTLTNFNKQKPVAVYDTRLKKPGVLTGTIKVITDQKELLENQLKQYQASIDLGFDEIHTYFITSNAQQFNLENLYNTLINQPYITKVELEVLSKTYEKN